MFTKNYRLTFVLLKTHNPVHFNYEHLPWNLTIHLVAKNNEKLLDDNIRKKERLWTNCPGFLP